MERLQLETPMKALGIYLAVSGTHPGPQGVDDDLDWHVRQAESVRATAVAAVPVRRSALVRGLLAFGRPIFLRRSLTGTAEQSARRT